MSKFELFKIRCLGKPGNATLASFGISPCNEQHTFSAPDPKIDHGDHKIGQTTPTQALPIPHEAYQRPQEA